MPLIRRVDVRTSKSSGVQDVRVFNDLKTRTEKKLATICSHYSFNCIYDYCKYAGRERAAILYGLEKTKCWKPIESYL